MSIIIDALKGAEWLSAHLPQLVRLLKKDRSNVVLTMLHNEHVVDVQNLVWPLSPNVHSRFVPCQRRFSFPTERPWLLNLPCASTLSLSCIVSKPGAQGNILLCIPISLIFVYRGLRSNYLVNVANCRARLIRMSPRDFELLCNLKQGRQFIILQVHSSNDCNSTHCCRMWHAL